LKLRNKVLFSRAIKPLRKTRLEVPWGSFPIKRLSGVSPDVMQAAVSTNGRTVRVLIRRLNSACSRSIALVVHSDAIQGVARLRPDQHDGWQALATAPIDQPIDLAP
jgi:hypothetical protein